MTKILIVTTNTNSIDQDNPTGVYFEEFARFYLTFKNAGYEITTASPKGGVSPIDPNSLLCENPTEWDESKYALDETVSLDDVNYKDFDAIVLPGGHGTMFDIANSEKLGEILQYFYENNKIIGAVCHGQAGFITAKKANGSPLVQGKRITSFSNEEEHISKTDEIMPFSLEDKLTELGAKMEFAKPYHEHVIEDGNIITGQNPKSTQTVADIIWKRLS
ncbi:glutamine amidotransferase class I [Candidatus Gastranaerophilus sp. (ex Termes propinquus)]|nr:glutamine amidotransferase class I [Candidatus Gastranaerophilus sp. (ex Termes propinquus)]